MANVLLLIQVLTGLAGQLQQVSALLNKAHSENRDVTRAELDALFADDDAARARLQALIDAKGGA